MQPGVKKRKRPAERWRTGKRRKRRKERSEISPSDDALAQIDHDDKPKPRKATGPRESRLAEFKKKRREFHVIERSEQDEKMRECPSEFLWDLYVQSVGNELTKLEAETEKWGEACVVFIGYSNDKKAVVEKLRSLSADVSSVGHNLESPSNLPGVETLALAPAALRAVALAKDLHGLGNKPVAKLFAKHMKIAEQAAFLKNHSIVPVATGTPNRVGLLLEKCHFGMEHTKLLVIDCKRNAKLQSIFDIHETCRDLFRLIHKHVRKRANLGAIRIVLLG